MLGYMNCHVDPFYEHQKVIPTLLLSELGKDFESGGFYLMDENDNKVFMDEKLSFGDLTLFNPQIPHGVDLIDKGKNFSEVRGRLMMIAGVNGYVDSPIDYNAQEISK